MNRVDAWRMIQRRAAELGTRVRIGCHTSRATGITAYLEAGGTLENAQAMASRESPRTTKLRVYISGQKRRVSEAIKRDLRRRSAVEPCIGHLKSKHRMGRNHLAHAAGDAANAVLAAAGYNFRRLLAWLASLLRA